MFGRAAAKTALCITLTLTLTLTLNHHTLGSCSNRAVTTPWDSWRLTSMSSGRGRKMLLMSGTTSTCKGTQGQVKVCTSSCERTWVGSRGMVRGCTNTFKAAPMGGVTREG